LHDDLIEREAHVAELLVCFGDRDERIKGQRLRRRGWSCRKAIGAT
jgi:hypothetical protein